MFVDDVLNKASQMSTIHYICEFEHPATWEKYSGDPRTAQDDSEHHGLSDLREGQD